MIKCQSDVFMPLENYPGYYINKNTLRMYSIKISGQLSPLKIKRGYRLTNAVAAYSLSVAGVKHSYRIEKLLRVVEQGSSSFSIGTKE